MTTAQQKQKASSEDTANEEKIIQVEECKQLSAKCDAVIAKIKTKRKAKNE